MTIQTPSLDYTPTIDLVVANGNWGTTSLNAIRAVLASAADILLEAFGRSPDTQVRIARWDQDPRVFDDARPYEIRINARDTYWCQYVYQFSHELCHVMTNFDRCTVHRHKWFEESLCELASLFVLHRLTDAWRKRPPCEIPQALDFAPHYTAYADEITSGYPRPSDDDCAGWLTENIATMEADPMRRDLNGLVAVTLLDHFRDNPGLWHDCVALNNWNPSDDATFSDYISSWNTCVKEPGWKGATPALVRETFRL